MASSTDPAVEIRRLWPADMPLFRDHMLRLDARSRHERFGGGMSDDFIVHYAESCFGQGDLVFGAFVDGRCAGRANCAPARRSGPNRRRSSAISTPRRLSASKNPIAGAASASNCSSASRAPRAITASRRSTSSACRTISACCASPRKFKTHFSFEENQFTGRLTARRPTPFSLMREASRDFVDFTSSLFDAQLRAIAAGIAEERVTRSPALSRAPLDHHRLDLARSPWRG